MSHKNIINIIKMSSFKLLQETTLSFPKTTEEPHFEKTSFRVKKKIFGTYSSKLNTLNVKLSSIDQNVFAAMAKGIIYPVPNKWGNQGWTIVELDKVEDEMLIDILKIAYCTVAPKKLVEQMKS